MSQDKNSHTPQDASASKDMAPVSDAAVPGSERFGLALKLERKKRKYSQKQLADLVGASQQAVAHWEKGRMLPRAEKGAKLIEIFGASSPLAYFVRIGSHLAYLDSPEARDLFFGKMRNESVVIDGSASDRKTRSASFSRIDVLGVREEIKTRLPPYLQINTGRLIRSPGYHLEIDYLSERLAVEFRHLHDRWSSNAISLGIHQLNKARHLLRESIPEAFVLIVIGFMPDNLDPVKRALAEAALFDIELFVMKNGVEAARFIERAEVEGLGGLLGRDSDTYDEE